MATLRYPITTSTATFSACRSWRWDLLREWDATNPRTLVCIGLNPSTADEEKNDPTVFGMIWRAQAWGYGRFVMLNAFGWRSTDPAGLLMPADPVGIENDQYIQAWARTGADVICAWGTGCAAKKLLMNREAAILRILRGAGVTPTCFAVNKDGSPKHPLYHARHLRPIEYAL